MLQDLRFALRVLAKERAFSSAAIVVLALDIGVNATGFTLINGAFLRGLALGDANHVYELSWRVGTTRRSALSHPEFEDWRAQSRSFAHLAALARSLAGIAGSRSLVRDGAAGWRVGADDLRNTL